MTKSAILVAVDLQHDAFDGQVVGEAVKLAKTHDSAIEVVFVIPDQQDGYAQHFVPDEMRARVQQEADRDLKAFGEQVDWQDVEYSTKVLRGVVYEKIIERADQLNAAFIVIGANRPNLKDFFIGPNAARVARHTNCSVLIVRP